VELEVPPDETPVCVYKNIHACGCIIYEYMLYMFCIDTMYICIAYVYMYIYICSKHMTNKA